MTLPHSKPAFLVQGQWTLGPGSVDNVSKLAQQMHLTLLREANEKLGTSHSAFSPWMSHQARVHELQPVFRDVPFEIIGDDRLKTLNTHLRTRNGGIGLELIQDEDLIVEFDEQVDLPRFSDSCRCALKWIESVGWLHQHFQNCVRSLSPMRALSLKPGSKMLFSSHLAKGNIFLQTGSDDSAESMVSLAVDLAHEVGHQVLMFYLNADPLIEFAAGTQVYSGARGILRNPYQSFHSAVALAFMVAAHKELRPLTGIKLRHFHEGETRRLTLALSQNITSIRSKCKLLPWGEALLSEWEQLL